MYVAAVTLAFSCCIAARADAQWHVAAFGGAAHTRPAQIRVEQPDRVTSLRFDDVAFDDKSFESPIYYGYRVLRVVSPGHGLFIGAELIHAKVYADGSHVVGRGTYRGLATNAIPFADVVQHFALSHGLNFVLADVGVRRRFSDRLTAHLIGGLGPMVPHVEVQVDGVGHEGYQLAGVGVQGAAGVEIGVWRRVSVLTEYKWSHAPVRLSLDSGHAELTATSHHFAIGVSAGLGR
jgi:opacity protein-like surface antigen